MICAPVEGLVQRVEEEVHVYEQSGSAAGMSLVESGSNKMGRMVLDRNLNNDRLPVDAHEKDDTHLYLLMNYMYQYKYFDLSNW